MMEAIRCAKAYIPSNLGENGASDSSRSLSPGMDDSSLATLSSDLASMRGFTDRYAPSRTSGLA